MVSTEVAASCSAACMDSKVPHWALIEAPEETLVQVVPITGAAPVVKVSHC